MPLNYDSPTEYDTGGTPMNRGVLRRINPMIFLTICCTLFVLVIVAALIVFTFLPIFTSTKENHTTYQIQSDALNLIYNLPDRLSTLPMNWTYIADELDSDKLPILQNLLQQQLNQKRLTRKSSVNVIDAYIVRQTLASPNLLVVSPVTSDKNNNTVIIITQPDMNTKINSTNQLIIFLTLRYALECGKKCQHNLKESIFAKTFHSIEVPFNTFRTLFIDELKVSTNQFPSTSTLSTARIPCIVNTPTSILSSSMIMARNYEAESSLNEFISTTIQSCSVCSGEQRVSNIGFTNELIFQQIRSQYGGSTTIFFYYTTDRIRFAQINVNDLSPSINVTFPIMSSNEKIAFLPVILDLCQGLNSIRIYNPNDYTPDFDRIVVY